MCAKSHIHQSCGRLPKEIFSTKGYAEIHIQRPFFDNKNSKWTILGLKIRTVETCSSACSTRRKFYFWKTLKSRFLVEFQSFIFGQIWAEFAAFSGWEHAQTWAKIFKTPYLFNCESKCYMQQLVGKLPSISIASKSFKKSKNLLHS
jgi:hypothetical protein